MGFFGDLWNAIEQGLEDGLRASAGASSSGILSSDGVTAGDVDIIQITLMSPDQTKKFELLKQVTMIEIYEDLLLPVVTADLHIIDAINLDQDFPLIGSGEYVKIVFQTPGTQYATEYKFRVKEIVNKKLKEGSKAAKTYTLRLASSEIFQGLGTLSTPYNQEIDKTIKDLVKNKLGSTKYLRTEKTSGIDAHGVTNRTPFQAIDMYRLRAVDKVDSKNPTGGLWVFFENKDGFNFTTLQKLWERGKKAHDKPGGSDKVFFYDSAPNLDAMAVNIRNIKSYAQVTGFNIAVAMGAGMFSSTRFKLDTIKGVVAPVSFKSSDDRDKNLGENTTSFFRKASERSSVITTLHMYNSSLPESFITEMLGRRRAAAAQIAQNITHIQVYGDTDITVGDVITCNFAEAKDATDEAKTNRIDSGKYLVAKVKHKILTGDRYQHDMTLEIIKGSVLENI